MGRESVEFSVVMPTYNRERYLGEAIASVLEQPGPPVELLVIDDRSTDGTRDLVRQLQERDDRIRYHRNAENVGASNSRNTGVELARGRYIVFLDSDDLLVQGHLQKARDAFRNSMGLGIFFCDSFILEDDDQASPDGDTWVRRNSRIYGYEIGTGARRMADVFLFSTSFPGMTLDRCVFTHVGGLSQRWFPVDDVELTFRVAAAGFGLFYLHEPLAYYRVHGENESGVAQMVRTCTKKVELLRRIAARHRELLRPADVERRIGQAELELAMAAYLERRYLGAIPPALRALVRHPPLVRTVAGRLWRRATTGGSRVE